MLRKSERPLSAVTTNGSGSRHESLANSKNHSASPADNTRSNASSPLFGTEPLPEDDFAHCPYCHKDFRKPRVLDCLHSMCEDCIIAQLDGRREQRDERKNTLECELEAPKITERPTPPGVIRCPVCAQESHVGNDVRYVHGMLLDYVRIAESGEIPNGTIQRRCRACKSEQPAVAICEQCQSDLCANCLTAHGVMRMFDGHVVTTYEELEKRGNQAATRQVVCTNHNQPFKFLCANCELLACKQCLEMEHVNHKVIEITDLVINAIRTEVTTLVDKVENKYDNATTEFNRLPDRTAQLQEQYEVARYRLEAYFDEILKAINEAKQTKLLELEDARHRQEHNIEELYRKMNVNEARVHDAFAFVRRLLSKANGIELLASRRKVVQQLGNLSHAIPSQGHAVELEFQPLSKKQMENNLNQLCGNVIGRVVQSVKDITPPSNDFAPFRAAPQDEWGRGSTPITTNTGLGAIGGERKNKNLNNNSSTQSNGTSSRSTTNAAEAFGWPPSSNPPELPPSPPPQNAQLPSLLNSGGVNNVNHQGLNLSAAAAAAGIRPELMALAAAGSVDIAALAAAHAAQAVNSNSGQVQLPNGSLGTHTNSTSLFPNLVWSQPHLSGLPNANNSAHMLAQQQKLALSRMIINVQSSNIQQQLNANPLLALNRLQNIDPLLLNMNNLNLSTNGPNGTPGLGPLGAPVVPEPPPAPVVSQQSLSQRSNELKVHSVFGTSQQGSSLRELHCPSGFCLSENDDILIADTNNHRVVFCGPPHPWKIGRPGTDDGQLCFPRKVIALRGDSPRYVVLDKGGDGKTRAQVFEARGEFVKRLNMVTLLPRGGIEVSAATATPNGGLLLVDTSGYVYSIDVDTPRITFCFDTSDQLGEASDVAMSDTHIYITDFKHHCVQVFTADGTFVRKMGEPSQTPYPIGIDVAKSGEILVADTHGNHLHVVVFNSDGVHQHSFTHNEFRLSRCVGLRIAKSGHIVTLCKHNHTLFVFKPLVLPNGMPVPQPLPAPQSLLTKFS
ncbi:unnamed protein product [Caenorhabditis bovis]|uniref:B box-type domain-containing protein n=1 Tax=Caenorhabditis bovis TaxID=2654633 RepID=A0A8S1EQR7_9PELO|nr:unnamed protein product [Caenorhabditis bovis]